MRSRDTVALFASLLPVAARDTLDGLRRDASSRARISGEARAPALGIQAVITSPPGRTG